MNFAWNLLLSMYHLKNSLLKWNLRTIDVIIMNNEWVWQGKFYGKNKLLKIGTFCLKIVPDTQNNLITQE